MSRLADIASTQPHAAYTGFVFGLQHRWTFIQRTMPTAEDHIQPLKDAIDHKLIPKIVKHELNDTELELMTLPTRLGGMSFNDPVKDSRSKHADSIECTAKLTQLITDNGTDVMTSIDQDLNQKMAVRQRHDVLYKIKADA